MAALPSAGAVPPPRLPPDAHADVPLPARPSVPWRPSASSLRRDPSGAVVLVNERGGAERPATPGDERAPGDRTSMLAGERPTADSLELAVAAEARASLPSRAVAPAATPRPHRVRALFIGSFVVLAALHVAGLISADDSQLPIRRDPRPAARPLPPPPMETCPADPSVFVLLNPEAPRVGEPLRILVGAYHSLDGAKIELVRDGVAGFVRDVTIHGGPTWTMAAAVTDLGPGNLAIRVRDSSRRLVACAEVGVSPAALARQTRPFAAFEGAWPVTAEWDERHETLFSAWLRQLFHVEPGARAGWAPLHQALKDPARNWLHGSLGLGEDDYNVQGHDTVEIRADCADTLYALRAYYAWKMGLPFLFHHCLRGDARVGPRCLGTVTNLDPHFGAEPNPVRRFNAFVGGRIASMVHSGTTRTLPDEEQSDFYPIDLTREAIRPGTVFINPYGHVLIVTQWQDQQPGRPGALFAVDGHPGSSVTHKAFARLWFPYMGWLRTGGFKAFRPAIFADGSVRVMSDDEIRARHWLPPPSDSQHQLSTEQWYDRMARIQNPRAVDPLAEARAAVGFLNNLVQERARVVDGAPGDSIPMPARPFTGFGASPAWRQHATPQLDLRILVAIERLDELPELADRGRYPFTRAMAASEMRALIRRELESRSVHYHASDGSVRSLTLAQLVERRDRFAVGYDPNDCPEYRWGEDTGSDAFATCGRRAPRNEMLRMYRLSSRLSIRWVPNLQ